MNAIVTNIVAAVIVLGVIIILHELGHFLVARYFKIRIETFSVGFGPRLIGFRRGDTDYRISAFPLGGYVKMAGDNPSEALTGDPQEFLSKPKWQRFLVASAGPIMNVLLAVVLLTGLFMYGREVPQFLTSDAIVGIVEAGSPADRAGVREGDRISVLDGKKNPNWQDVESRIELSAGTSLPLVLSRNGELVTTTITPVKKEPTDRGFVGMGPHLPVIVKSVWGEPAKAAGLQPGDEVTVVNGIELKSSAKAIQAIIQGIPDPNFPIVVLRHGAPVTLQITPVIKDGQRFIGMNLEPPPSVLIKLGFTAALSKSMSTNVEYGKTIFQVIGMLFQRKASLKQLDGPIGIVRASGEALNEGVATLIGLMALISLNLGLLNILPIPVLDGGVMTMLIVESLMGRDLSLRLKERIIQVSVVALLMLTVLVLYNDVLKMFPVKPAHTVKALRPEMQVFIEYLQTNKLKLTPHRELILETFLENEGHRSVEDIYHAVKKADPRIGYTTVYRMMKLMIECGLAREIELADGITRYEHLFNHEHHDHMICMECGKSIEFFNPEIEVLQEAASAQLGFKVLDHKLQIYGVCRDCR